MTQQFRPLTTSIAILVLGLTGCSTVSMETAATSEAVRAPTPPKEEARVAEQPAAVAPAEPQPPPKTEPTPPPVTPAPAEPQPAPPPSEAAPPPVAQAPVEPQPMPPPKEEVRVTEQPVSAIPAEPQPAPPPSEAAPPPVAQAPAEPPPQAESAPPPAAQAPVEPQPTAPQIAQAPVEAQPTPPPSEAAPPPVLSLADALFDFDRFAIRDDAKPILEGNAKELRKLTGMRLLIEGHCDERGTRAYNLVLGERRAKSVKEYLIDLGITGEAIQITSFGKERPICTEHTEECYQRNRRAHFVLK